VRRRARSHGSALNAGGAVPEPVTANHKDPDMAKRIRLQVDLNARSRELIDLCQEHFGCLNQAETVRAVLHYTASQLLVTDAPALASGSVHYICDYCRNDNDVVVTGKVAMGVCASCDDNPEPCHVIAGHYGSASCPSKPE